MKVRDLIKLVEADGMPETKVRPGTLKGVKHAVVIEKGPRNYSAYVPDLPGCIATGKTLEEVETNMREAIEFHIEGMIELRRRSKSKLAWRNCRESGDFVTNAPHLSAS